MGLTDMIRSKIRKYVSVFLRLVRLEIMTDMQYRLNFLFSFISTTSWLGAELLFFHFVLQKYQAIAGWDIYEIGSLVAVNQMWTGGIFLLVVWPSLSNLASGIKTGKLDRTLALPMNKRFLVSVSHFDINSFVIFAEGVILLVYCMLKIGLVITFSQVLLFVIFFILVCWIIYCFQFISTVFIFWLTEAGTLLYSIHIVDRLSRFPYEIFAKGILLIMFTFVFPATIICNVPVRALFGILDWNYVLYLLIAAVWFTLISQLLWKAGLKRYESASS